MADCVIIAPGKVVSGGPEALHQLASAIRGQGGNAAMCYFPFDEIAQSPEAYAHYGVPHCRFDEIGHRRVVLPEARTGFSRLFAPEQVCIWWLSVDNYQGQVPGSGPVSDPERHLRLSEMGGFTHFAQSRYAQEFLSGFGFESMPLSDYLSDAHQQIARRPPPSFDIVYNNAKGRAMSQSLARAMPDLNFKAIGGMTPAEVSEVLSAATIYLDFGRHPGKDRMPREAALAGCSIITGRLGAAANPTDVPIPDLYKIDQNAASFLEDAESLIRAILADPDTHRKVFASYRNTIMNEKNVFWSQVKAAFLLP